MCYRTFSGYLRERFGRRVQRISLEAGFTCPNRDGTSGFGGCAYCSPEGSWGREKAVPPLDEQVRRGKDAARRRYGAEKFIAYFQAFTNTYAPVERLKTIYDSVLLRHDDFVGLAVGTRPDCIDDEKLLLIESYAKLGLMVWIEYGLQTSNNRTLRLIGRGHTAEDFAVAVLKTKTHDILVSTHVIIGLPGESGGDSLATARFVAGLPVDGVKLHNLNIVEGTRVAEMYRRGEVRPLSLREYSHRVVDFLELTDPCVVVDRLVADTPSPLLIEPKWSLDKRSAIAAIRSEFRRRNSRQGMLFQPGGRGSIGGPVSNGHSNGNVRSDRCPGWGAESGRA
jgi:radical SAM protein (TIGR01212 family)